MRPGWTTTCRAYRAMRTVQTVTHSEGYSRKLYGHGGIMPAFVNHQRGVAAARPAVPLPRGRRAGDAAQPAQGEGRSARGHQGRLRQPGDRRGCVQDLELFGAALRPGEETELKRETAGTYYVVIEGTGATAVGGKALRVEPQRPVVVPNFLLAAPHQHRQDRRSDLLRVRRHADEEHRPVLCAGSLEGRQGHRAGALSEAQRSGANFSAGARRAPAVVVWGICDFGVARALSRPSC